MPPKRKRSSLATDLPAQHETSIPLPKSENKLLLTKRQPARRGQNKTSTNPDKNPAVVDGKTALRASPDADEKGEAFDIERVVCTKPSRTPLQMRETDKISLKQEENSDSPLSDIGSLDPTLASKKLKKRPTKSSIAAKKGSDEIKAFKAEQAAKKASENAKVKKEDDAEHELDRRVDPDGDDAAPVEDVDVMKREAGRPPPVNSDYLPLPWKGRLGYACLNTYLRFSNPPVFTSRTCRMQSILDHRHPLKDPSQPEHSTKNRPDKTQPASVERGQRYVEELCLANVRDLPKMIRWNEKYGIKFMRLSSEMFPFASHLDYGYKLAPFASEALAEAGKVIAELGHRVSTHPGQFTQLGSPRSEVIASSVRDLDYHDEMLSLLKLPEQMDRDAVLILHMGGVFGDKAATLGRFRENYKDLKDSVKMRLVLENDDVSYSVHDLLPICEELNIPLCLDFHHHNIIFDSSQVREGTLDIMSLYPRIKATWDRKGITQKMHYSEGCPEAVTGRQRRKHNPRPITLPPCPNTIDLMIEAKDKEQAVFELMRTFKLPGHDKFNNIIPYERADDNKPLPKKAKKKKTKKQITAEIQEFGKELSEEEEELKAEIPGEEVAMGGPESRVYWPPGMEEWLRPKKREVNKKGAAVGEDEDEMFRNPTPSNLAARKAVEARNKAPLQDAVKEKLKDANSLSDFKKILDEIKAGNATQDSGDEEDEKPMTKRVKATPVKKETPSRKKAGRVAPIPSVSSIDGEEDEDLSMPDLSAEEGDELAAPAKKSQANAPTRQSRRASKKQTSYVEVDEDVQE